MRTRQQDLTKKPYVDAAVAAEHARIDTLVNGAPLALDTLAEIAAQLATDEIGVAAILATQGQHTTQIATTSTALTTKANQAEVVWFPVLDGGGLTVGRGIAPLPVGAVYAPTSSGCVFGSNHLNNHYGQMTTCVFGDAHSNNAYADSHYYNHYGGTHLNNTYGSSHNGNVYGNSHRNNTYGNSHFNNVIGVNVRYCTFGDGMSECIIGRDVIYVSLGANCKRVRVYDTTGTESVPVLIPANSIDVTYRNGVLVKEIKTINNLSPDTAGNVILPPPGTTLSADTQAALVGTTGIPSATNKYLTTTDPRLLDTTSTNFVLAQTTAYSRFPAGGSAPIGYATLAALGAAVTPGDTIRYNRSFSTDAATVTLNGIWLDGQQNVFNLTGAGSTLTFNNALIFDFELTGDAQSLITFTGTTNYVRGGSIGSFTVAAGAAVVLDGVRSVGAVLGTGTLVLRGATGDPNNVRPLTPRTYLLDDQRGVSGAGLLGILTTHAQLVSALTNSLLIPGRYYQITDYQTIHVIPNTTTVCENGVVLAATTTTYAGATLSNGSEALVVQALTTNKLAAKAFSPSNPQDEIEYNITPVLIGNGISNKGTITRRKDTVKNIETQYDFRTVKFRRWQVTGVATTPATVANDTLQIALVSTDQSASSMLVRATAFNAALITKIQFTNATVPLYHPIPANYLVSGVTYLVKHIVNGAYCILVDVPALETKTSTQYLALTSTAIQSLGAPYTTFTVGAAFQDGLTFGNYANSFNVRLGMVPSVALNSVVFGAAATNINLSDSANCTFVGVVNQLNALDTTLRNMTVTGAVLNARMFKTTSNILIANDIAASWHTQGNFSSSTSTGFRTFVAQANVSGSYFNCDSNPTYVNAQLNIRVNAMTDSVLSGNMESTRFHADITSSYVGNSLADVSGGVAFSSDYSILGSISSSIFSVGGGSASWVPGVLNSAIKGYLTATSTVLGNYSSGFYSASPNATLGTVTYSQIGVPAPVTFTLGLGVIPILYSALVTLVATSTLQVDKPYLITDYQTIHVIPNTTTAICENGVVLVATTANYTGGNFATNGGEPLVVRSIANNKLAVSAFSPLNPQDAIDYTLTATTIGNGFTNKGLILRRKDTIKNVEVMYDFRTVKFRRWKVTALSELCVGTISNNILGIPISQQDVPSYFAIIRVQTTNTVAIDTIGYTDYPTTTGETYPVGFLVAGRAYALHTMSGLGRPILVDLSALETRLTNQYLSTVSTATSLGSALGNVLVNALDFRDALTFGNYASTTNVRLGRNSALALNNVVFGGSVTLVSLSDAGTSTFIGNVATLTGEGLAMRLVSVTGIVSSIRLGRNVTGLLLSSVSTATFDAYGTLTNICATFMRSIVFTSSINNAFFDGVNGRFQSSVTFYSITNTFIIGYVIQVRFNGFISNSVIGSYLNGVVISQSSCNGDIADSLFIPFLSNVTWSQNSSGLIITAVVYDSIVAMSTSTGIPYTMTMNATGTGLVLTSIYDAYQTFTLVQGVVQTYVDSADTALSTRITNIQTQVTTNTSAIGTLANLPTTNKGSLVLAISEVSAVANLASLGVSQLRGFGNDALGLYSATLGGASTQIGNTAQYSVTLGGHFNSLKSSYALMGACTSSNNDNNPYVSMFGFDSISLPSGIPAGLIAPNLTLYTPSQTAWDGTNLNAAPVYKKIGFNGAGGLTINGVDAAMRYFTSYVQPLLYNQGDVVRVNGKYYIQPTALYRSTATFTPTAWDALVGEVILAPLNISSTNPITFQRDTDYDSQTSGFDNAGSASAFNLSGGIRGVTVRVEYTPSTAITFPAACVIMSGNSLVLNVLNVIYFRFVRPNRVDVTIA